LICADSGRRFAPARQRISPIPRNIAGAAPAAGNLPALEDLGAPPALRAAGGRELLLVTGRHRQRQVDHPGGDGGHLNQHLDGHILTLEDPVEFIHHSERCLIQQREIGRHCPRLPRRCAWRCVRIRM
jgi:Tfp pilus assembly ATPase PilU